MARKRRPLIDLLRRIYGEDGYDAEANAKGCYDLAISTMREKLESFHKVDIGPHRLWLGDCRVILPLLPKVDALVMDPPYGMGLEYSRVNNRGTKREDRMIANDADTSARAFVLETARFDAAVVFGTPKVEKPIGAHATLVWSKGDHVGMGDLSFPWKLTHEEIYILGDKSKFSGHRDGSVLAVNALYPNLPAANMARGEPLEHPTQKPIALMSAILQKIDASTVLDPFMGSGTTGVACQKLGRRFIGVEIEPRYHEIACRRITEAMNQPDMFITQPSPEAVQLALPE